MTYDETTAVDPDKSSSQDGCSRDELAATNNNSAQLEDESKLGSTIEKCSVDACCTSDQVNQIDEENGLTEPSLESSSYSSSSSAHPACRSASSSTSSTHCKQSAEAASVSSDIDAGVIITDCISRVRRDSCSTNKTTKEDQPIICYNPALDDEIRNRLDKLNSLSDLINSLELQFDQANLVFRETLKCSTERLSIIAKTLGSKSIRHGRTYHEAKISVEQSQSDCQRACVQFERANHDHQHAKEAIKRAEMRLKQMNSSPHNTTVIGVDCTAAVGALQNTSFEFSDLCRLKLEDQDSESASKSSEYSQNHCDKNQGLADRSQSPTPDHCVAPTQTESSSDIFSSRGQDGHRSITHQGSPDSDNHEVKMKNDAKLSEELNQAIIRLIDAEQKRRESEKAHLDQANKLMFAQENLTKIEREHCNSIRRSQVYFDEARRFNARLDSVKSDISRISGDIIAAKKAYARTLKELEQFSEDLHDSSKQLADSQAASKD